jgi:hypothetical protein
MAVCRLSPKLFRIETEDLVLPTPFGQQIAKAFGANTAGQATFDGGF